LETRERWGNDNNQFPTSPPVALQWKVAAVDEHFRRLGVLRAGMKPEFPKNFAVGQKLTDVIPQSHINN
jgi:hypothetical protein